MRSRSRVLLWALALLPCLHAVAQCPPVSSVFDLPDIHTCRNALHDIRQHQPCPPRPRVSPCCEPALAFLAAKCHCWRTFDGETVGNVKAIATGCAAPQQQPGQQQYQEAQEFVIEGRAGAGALQGGGGAAAGASGDGLAGRETQGGRGREPIFLPHSGVQQQASGGGGAAGNRSASASASTSTSLRLFVGVLSRSDRRGARDAIRATWGSHPLLYRVRFFLTRSPNDTLFDEVRREAVEQRDLVVLPMVTEHYFNITYQTLEVCRTAAADPDATHVLKVDDDSYVRVDKLFWHLPRLPAERLYWGHMEDPGGGPIRNPKSQWYVTKEEWESDRYPPWAHGTGYVLSADLVREIAAGAAVKRTGGRLFKLEDVSMGSWVEWVEQERGKPINRVKEAGFNFAGCSMRDLVSHYITPEQQRCIWEAGGKACRCSPAGAQSGRQRPVRHPARHLLSGRLGWLHAHRQQQRPSAASGIRESKGPGPVP